MIDPAMETERRCPECGEAFLHRTVWNNLRCPNGDYVEEMGHR